MPDDPTSIVLAELRRQVDHQITAATSTDTKAAGLIAAVFALFALVVPRVGLDGVQRVGMGAITFSLALGTMTLLAMAIRPRKGRFSYGPTPTSMFEYLDKWPDKTERAMADSFEAVKIKNASVIDAKAEALNAAIWLMIATVVGLAGLVVVGGIR